MSRLRNLAITGTSTAVLVWLSIMVVDHQRDPTRSVIRRLTTEDLYRAAAPPELLHQDPSSMEGGTETGSFSPESVSPYGLDKHDHPDIAEADDLDEAHRHSLMSEYEEARRRQQEEEQQQQQQFYQDGGEAFQPPPTEGQEVPPQPQEIPPEPQEIPPQPQEVPPEAQEVPLDTSNAYVVPPPQEGLYPPQEPQAPVSPEQPMGYPEAQVGQRPIMHTFYSPIIQTVHKSGTGMDEESDADLLQLWKETWSAAGFEPKVLTLEDAKRHPQFERYDEALDGMPFGYYDRLCFLRWLAMAASGGGWMSDYDVLPLNPPNQYTVSAPLELPNGGRLTVYSGLPAGKRGAVPCLVSGTAQEWDRMSRLLLENTIAHRESSFWSDMFAIVDIDETRPGEEYEIRWDVVAGHLVLIGEQFSDEHCLLTNHKRAVHFSHDALDRGVLREGETYRDRPSIARNWLAMWRTRCPLTEVTS